MKESEKFDAVEGDHEPYYEESDGNGADYGDEKYDYVDPKIKMKAIRDRIE
jgi:hypothetical protein